MYDYDAEMRKAIAKAQDNIASENLYSSLITQYYTGQAPELKFLADMPYDQGLKWVIKTFAEFVDLNTLDPDNFPMQMPRDVIKTMRAYRKSKRKKAAS